MPTSCRAIDTCAIFICEHVGHLIKCEQNELPAELIYICMIILYAYINIYCVGYAQETGRRTLKAVGLDKPCTSACGVARPVWNVWVQLGLLLGIIIKWFVDYTDRKQSQTRRVIAGAFVVYAVRLSSSSSAVDAVGSKVKCDPTMMMIITGGDGDADADGDVWCK